MRGRSTIWFPLTVLAFLAALSLWIEHAVQPPPPKQDGSSRHDPDYKVSNFNTIKTDEQGKLRYALAAVEMVHYPDDDSTELVRPRFTQYTADKPYTQIQAQRGLVSSNGKDVYFMDNVIVERGATPQKGKLIVRTEYLHVVPDLEVANTDRPVTILQEPHTVARANGMEYNKKERTLQLFKRVHVHYEKPGAKTAKTAPPAAATNAKNPPAGEPAAQNTGAKTLGGKSSQSKTNSGNTRVRRQYDQSPSNP